MPRVTPRAGSAALDLYRRLGTMPIGSPPAEQALANRRLRCRFVSAVLARLRRTPEVDAVF